MATGAEGVEPAFDALFTERLEALFRWRRDVRRFRRDEIAPERMEWLLEQACRSPSVGYSQPWRFVLVEDAGRRKAVRDNFLACNAEALGCYSGERAGIYAGLKLEGLDAAPVQLAVFTDHTDPAGHGLGRRTMPEMLDYSIVMAVHTLWLSARACGIGVGWVSILDPVAVADILAVPEGWKLTAYLCIGWPEKNADMPELARSGWEQPDDKARILYRR